LLLSVIIFSGGLAWALAQLNSPHRHQMSTQVVNIASGAGTEAIVEKLVSAGIIDNPLLFKLYVKAKKGGPLIKAGDYIFPSPISPVAVLTQLQSGGLVPHKFTIIEGWTRWDIARAMAAMPALKLKNADQALKLMNDTSSIKDLSSKASSLEGFMFPDTYSVHSYTTAKDLIESSVQRFHEIWKQNLKQQAEARRQLPLEVVTIASLVETEAKLPEERPVVASVIYNRLARGMRLSVDCTIVYASKLAGKWKNDGKVYLSDVNRDSPYNTRKVNGLPPGPVGAPGLASLRAALNPADTNFLYYVREPSRNDGKHNFYADSDGFERGVQALRSWEQKRDAAFKSTAAKKKVLPGKRRK